MARRTLFSAVTLAVVLGASGAHAVPLDLSGWSALTLDIPGGQPAGNWALSNGNTTATQTVNADPSMFLNGLNQTAYTMDGSWRVNTTGDDDFMGFVFGYQDASHFYVMDWKQLDQNEGGAYGNAFAGFSVKKISANSSGDFTHADFWESGGTAHSTVLASNWASNKGWADNTLYDFHLEFNSGSFDITVQDQSNTTLWDVTVNDNSYLSGQFGFYNFSQELVEYNGFEQEGGVVVPEPASLLLLGLGAAGLGLRSRRKRS